MAKYVSVRLTLLILAVTICEIQCRKHHLQLKGENRRIIEISRFGFLKDGFLSVELHQLIVRPNSSLASADTLRKVIGFTVDRTLSDGLNPYAQTNMDSTYCGLTDLPRMENIQHLSRLSLVFDLHGKTVKMQCSEGMDTLKIFKNISEIPTSPFVVYKRQPFMSNSMAQLRRKRQDEDFEPPSEVRQQLSSSSPPPKTPEGQNPASVADGDRNVESVGKVDGLGAPSGNSGSGNPSPVQETQNVQEENSDKVEFPSKKPSSQTSPGLVNSEFSPSEIVGSDEFQRPCGNPEISLTITQEPDGASISTSFVVYIPTEEMEGLYNLYFHNCLDEDAVYDLNMSIVEENQGRNYLSAGEMPLPSLYFLMSIIFFISGCFWVFILRKSKRETGVAVYKIHYLMGALVFLKSLSLLFHSINYHYIQTRGTHVEGFAILWYAVHLLKGALLFITILLIGTGYAFVKHFLSDKDKKIFMIVIPLQVLANVATIIIEESEEAEIRHNMWRMIFIAVDLICCMAILFPVVWSIRHLQEASNTDGKAATNLKKLKLFRHFYIIVVCYIYFTRIIVNLLLQITVPFQYQWLDEMFTELTTFIFYVLTGYKFRPAPNNPYLTLAHDSDDETETDIALTESGLTAGVSKRGSRTKKKTLKEIVYFDDDSDDDEEVLLEKNLNREANHDFL